MVVRSAGRDGEIHDWPARHTTRAEEDVVFIEIGPVEPMRPFGDHAKRALG